MRGADEWAGAAGGVGGDAVGTSPSPRALSLRAGV